MTIIVMFVMVANASAGPVLLTDFSGRETVIDFETIEDGELVTDQYVDLGVEFTGTLHGDPHNNSTIQGNQEVVNFVSGANTITAIFTEPQVRAGIFIAGMVDGGNDILLSAFRGVDLVDSATFNTGDMILPDGSLPSVFAGIEVLDGFDSLSVERTDGTQVFSFDDFRFEDVIPEPGTAVSVLLGIAAISQRRREASRTRLSRRSR